MSRNHYPQEVLFKRDIALTNFGPSMLYFWKLSWICFDVSFYVTLEIQSKNKNIPSKIVHNVLGIYKMV